MEFFIFIKPIMFTDDSYIRSNMFQIISFNPLWISKVLILLMRSYFAVRISNFFILNDQSIFIFFSAFVVSITCGLFSPVIFSIYLVTSDILMSFSLGIIGPN